MNIKLYIKSILMISFIAFFAACTSGQKKGDSKANERAMIMDQANQALSDVTYSPYGKGWQYKNVIVPPADFSKWSSQFKEQIIQALESVGDGFLLQVTGHTCSMGPREAEPENNKKGNIWYSEERAKAVYNELIKQGVSKEKMIFMGVADDEPLPAKTPQDQLNRRVTFKIVEDLNAAEEGTSETEGAETEEN